MNAQYDQMEARRGRWAVAAMFLANGFVVGSWAPQIPVVVDRLGITEFAMGLMILVFGIGAVTAMVLSGAIIARHGSRASLRFFAAALLPALPLVALGYNVPLVAAAMLLLGGAIGAMDVAMNSNAVAVEKRLGRAVMSSSHGFWSLGGFAGGAAGGILIQQFGHLAHALIVAVLALLVVLWAWSRIVADVDDGTPQEGQRTFSWPRNPTIYIIGVMALLTMNSEGAVLDWAALYINREMGADLATAGFAFAGFSGAMAVTRFAGDGIRNRFGAVKTFRLSGMIAAAGMLVAGLSPWPWLTIGAFTFSGLGIANMVPILFSAAGNQPGTSSGAGMSVVTTIGYCGLLVAPSLIGFIGGEFGFAPVYVAVAGLLAVILFASRLTAAADLKPNESVHDPVPI